MEQASATEVPQDWYRSAFPASHTLARPWAEQTEGEIDRVVAILRPPEGARVLDLACGTGRHSIELARRMSMASSRRVTVACALSRIPSVMFALSSKW